MTWMDMLAHVRLKLSDSGQIWSDEELLRYGNETLDSLCMDSKAHTKTVQFLLDGTRRVTLPQGYHALRWVKINGQSIGGVRSHDLEKYDSSYLITKGTSEWYYIEDSRSLAFYRVPSWTDSYVGTFDAENGVVTSMELDDYWTFDSEDGLVTAIIDDSMQYKFKQDSWDGVVTGLNDGPMVVEIGYVYQPARMVENTDEPDLPLYMHYGLEFGVLKKAFARPGQGKNPRLEGWYGSRYDEYAMYWRRRNLEWARGEDHLVTAKPMTWGSARRTWRVE